MRNGQRPQQNVYIWSSIVTHTPSPRAPPVPPTTPTLMSGNPSHHLKVLHPRSQHDHFSHDPPTDQRRSSGCMPEANRARPLACPCRSPRRGRRSPRPPCHTWGCCRWAQPGLPLPRRRPPGTQAERTARAGLVGGQGGRSGLIHERWHSLCPTFCGRVLCLASLPLGMAHCARLPAAR